MKIEVVVSEVLVGETEDSLVTSSKDHIKVDLEGVVGDRHRGFSKLSVIRDIGLLHDRSFPKSVEVRNGRQWSAVSIEDLEKIAHNLEVPYVNPDWLGANISFTGVERFSTLPRGTTLSFPEDAILIVEEQNKPCIDPGHIIAKRYPGVDPSLFVKAAMGLRGLVGVVDSPGIIRYDDRVIINVYESKPYFINN